MNEDCLHCGTGMYDLDEDRLCPGCSNLYYNWEEREYTENKVFYEHDLESLEALPKKGKHE